MKVFKGGYKIVSLLNIDITSDFTISGIYDDIKDSHGKPILVSEINVGGEKMNDAYTIVKQDNTDYIIEVYGYSLTIASDDSVTVAEVESVSSIGGVSGEITLGTGLSITEGGELSAVSGSVKYYKHFYRNVTGNVTVYCVTTYDTLATTKADFMKRILASTCFIYFDSSETLRIGCGAHVSTFPTVDGTGSLYLLGVSNADSPQWNRTTITSFSTNSSNTVTEL